MIILSIESSADETGIAVLTVTGKGQSATFTVLANEVASQAALHAQYGGVFPAMAKREHARNIIPLMVHALSEAKLLKEKKKPKPVSAVIERKIETLLSREHEVKEPLLYILEKYEIPKIDRIAVTVGPGLEPTLWVGINVARALATLWNVPLTPVNHMEGHMLSVLVPSEGKKSFKLKDTKLAFPAISLLVSGGHTELILVKGMGKYQKIGHTLDDAAGEAFDKVARMLELPYPGGPEISRLAAVARATMPFSQWELPRPMIGSPNFDFSFSGLKTSVLYKIRDHKKPLSDNEKKDLAREFEEAVVDVLVTKTLRAASKYKIKSIIVGGGVSANTYLRTELARRMREHDLVWVQQASLSFPTLELSTDNGLMIAIAGYFGKKKSAASLKKLTANGNLSL
jgi:N6-L-threonylcarbamoyladenine synthase